MSYLFTSESVSEGHPDKIADQISDGLLDAFLIVDENSRVACETIVTTGLVVVAGEVTTEGYVDIQEEVRKIIEQIGYTKPEYQFEAKSCGILCAIHEQSPDIKMGVVKENPEEQGAGDQGIMFGYACKETDNYMPLPIELANLLVKELANIRKEGRTMTYLRPDAKSQVTIEYDNGKPKRIDKILISTQHDPFIKPINNTPSAKQESFIKMQNKIKEDIKNILIPRVIEQLPSYLRDLFKTEYELLVNPTGAFIIGGPHGDTGLTGRKIIVDTYGGRAPHGGGAFSGKDASKVDRSASYAVRHIAKNLVAAGVSDEVLIQVSYAIGVSQPLSLYVNTFGKSKAKDANNRPLSDEEIAKKILEIYDLRPYHIIKNLKLKNPIYRPTAAYGHFGRTPYKKKIILYKPNGNGIKEKNTNNLNFIEKEIEFFTWEKLDLVDLFKETFHV
ncbi:MAG: methionine adenosyltransferase [Bacteroidales bacterium]|nr:methionine adenosyltransferase [Bacteroidales bacterium]